jgi:uncharacterized protein YbcI
MGEGQAAVDAAAGDLPEHVTKGPIQLASNFPSTSRTELQELTHAMVRLYKDQFGRGPTKSRSDYAGPDVIVCTLEDSMTPVEANMARLGEHGRLRDMRMWFQHVTESQFTAAVEEITGRKVRAFVSGMDTTKDVSAEIFYLEAIEDGDE